MELAVAIDFSGVELAAAAALHPAGELLFENWLPMKGREAAALLAWLEQQLEAVGYGLDEVKFWTISTGPGSFTGLRILSSLISGVVYQREGVKARGIPSVWAIAADFDIPDGKQVAVLHDGRRGELLLYGLDKKGPDFSLGTTAVIVRDKLEELNEFDLLLALARDRDAIAACLPEEDFQKVKWTAKFPVARLLSAEMPWDQRTLTDLIYLRPAVFPK